MLTNFPEALLVLLAKNNTKHIPVAIDQKTAHDAMRFTVYSFQLVISFTKVLRAKLSFKPFQLLPLKIPL